LNHNLARYYSGVGFCTTLPHIISEGNMVEPSYEYLDIDKWFRIIDACTTIENMIKPPFPPPRTIRTGFFSECETKKSIQNTKNYNLILDHWSDKFNTFKKTKLERNS